MIVFLFCFFTFEDINFKNNLSQFSIIMSINQERSVAKYKRVTIQILKDSLPRRGGGGKRRSRALM